MNPNLPGNFQHNRLDEVIRSGVARGVDLIPGNISLAAAEHQLAGQMMEIPGSCYHMGDMVGDGCADDKPVDRVCVSLFRNGFLL
jgi:hypothetical protein